MHVYRDVFTKAYADIELFSQRGRSGSEDGRPSIPCKTLDAARQIVDDAARKGLLEPTLSVTQYDSIRLEWEDEQDWHISALITGDEGYSYTIFRKACTIAGRARPSVTTCGKSLLMVLDQKLENSLMSMKNLVKKPAKQAPFSIPDHIKNAELSNIRQRLTSISSASDESSKTYWKGALLGEINMLMRLDVLDRLEWMELQNEVAKAAGDYPYFNYKKLQMAKNLRSGGDS